MQLEDVLEAHIQLWWSPKSRWFPVCSDHFALSSTHDMKAEWRNCVGP